MRPGFGFKFTKPFWAPARVAVERVPTLVRKYVQIVFGVALGGKDHACPLVASKVGNNVPGYIRVFFESACYGCVFWLHEIYLFPFAASAIATSRLIASALDGRSGCCRRHSSTARIQDGGANI